MAKTGSAVTVVLDGPPGDPVVADRRRVDLLQPGTPGHAYHAAAELEPAAAAELVAKVQREALDGAIRGFATLAENHVLTSTGS